MEPRARASGEQFSALLEYMESHGDLSKPQPGAQGRLRADRLWQELANLLNSIGGGVNKNPEKLKKPKVVKKKGGARSLGVCPICRQELGTNPLASTKCGHVFCMACLQTSLQGRDRHCPTCRRALRGTTAYHPLYL